MDATLHETRWTIEINGTEVNVEYQPRELLVVDSTAVALLVGWSESDVDAWEDFGVDLSHEKPPFDVRIPSPTRNVIGLNADGENVWTIPEAPDDPPEDSLDTFYLNIWEIGGDVWVRNENQHAYRLSPQTGEIVETLRADQLRLGENVITISGGWVKKVLHLDDGIAVISQPANHPQPDGRNLYVFEDDGTERWWIGDKLEGGGPDAPPFTNIWLEDGDLYGYSTDGYEYRFDQKDGALLGEEWVK